MTSLLVYSIIGILIILVAAVLVRQRDEREEAGVESYEEYASGLFDESGLSVAERIFDPTDYLWLRHKVGFPRLARVLARSRRRIAIKWLKALQHSFAGLVRIPEATSHRGVQSDAPGSWELLWLTLRFHLLLAYATLVVRWFGPYHRLIPPLGGMRTPAAELYSRRERYGTADLSDLH